MAKTGSSKALGLKMKEAIFKFGRIEGNGAVVCFPTKELNDNIGTNDEIRQGLNDVGINDMAVEDVVSKDGKKMTCVATTVEELTKEN